MIRVAITDDHSIVRRGLRQIVADSGHLEVVIEAESYAALSRSLVHIACDVLVLDVSMPDKNGLETLKLIRAHHPRLQVLMLSMYPEDQYAVRAIRAGAAGYLTKDSAPEKLVEALTVVASGKRYITPAVGAMLADSLGEDANLPRHALLSDREFQTLVLIAQGKPLAQIAAALALSPKTVSVYRARLLEKMQVGSNAELTQYALRNGLIA